MTTWTLIMLILDTLFVAYHLNKSYKLLEWNTLFLLFWITMFFRDVGAFK